MGAATPRPAPPKLVPDADLDGPLTNAYRLDNPQNQENQQNWKSGLFLHRPPALPVSAYFGEGRAGQSHGRQRRGRLSPSGRAEPVEIRVPTAYNMA